MQDTYIPPILTVDGVILQLVHDKLCVLLIKRQRKPFKDQWALPGGYNPQGETTMQALTRVLQTKAGIGLKKMPYIEQLYAFDTVARDPRGHAVSITYLGLGKNIVPVASATTENPTFFAINNLPKLAYDHADIIAYAHERLRSKITHTNAVFALLPRLFSLSELQSAYEAIFCQALDKRNFRKKFLSFGLIEPTGEQRSTGAHRPARLYKFKRTTLEVLSRSFE